MKKVCAYVCEKLQITPATVAEDARSRASSIVPASIQGSRRPSAENGPGGAPAVFPPLTQIHTPPPATVIGASGEAALEKREQDLTPIEMVEILCNDVVLPPHATLAQVQRFAWKGPTTSDVKLEYRWAL